MDPKLVEDVMSLVNTNTWEYSSAALQYVPPPSNKNRVLALVSLYGELLITRFVTVFMTQVQLEQFYFENLYLPSKYRS